MPRDIFAYRILVGCIAALLLLFLAGMWQSRKLKTIHYTIASDKLSAPIRIALVTDLHACWYGEEQAELVDAVLDLAPDVVLLGGDIFDDELPFDNARAFVSAIAAQFPTYYVAGNHEHRRGEMDTIHQMVRDAGAAVLAGDCVPLTIGTQTINLCGVDDPEGMDANEYTAQLNRTFAAAEPGRFTILLTHRPERIQEYLAHSVDLVLAGHAHGGQWRIPGLLNGLIAPNQGLFPKYAGGKYDFASGATMVVSRGLARESTRIPRVYNPPELVFVELTGRGT